MRGTNVFLRWAAVLLLGATGGVGVLEANFIDDLARVHVEAAGGREAQAALRSLRATGVTRIAGQELPFILYAARPRSIRIETLGEGGTLLRVFDGVHVPWQKGALLSPPKRLASGQESDFVVEAEFDTLLYDFRTRGIDIEDAGRVEVEGRPCLRLLVTVRLADAFTLYVDEETLLVVRRDQKKSIGGRQVVVETYYSDFRPVAGVLMPFLIRTQSSGRVATETVITEMVPNPQMPAGFFSPPVAGWPRW